MIKLYGIIIKYTAAFGKNKITLYNKLSSVSSFL